MIHDLPSSKPPFTDDFPEFPTIFPFKNFHFSLGISDFSAIAMFFEAAMIRSERFVEIVSVVALIRIAIFWSITCSPGPARNTDYKSVIIRFME
jgi:hypothetical protein